MPNDGPTISRSRLLRPTYRLLFGLACGGLTAALTTLSSALGDLQWSPDDFRMWLPSVAVVVLGWIVSGRALRQPALHTACRWIGGLGTVVCLGGAAYWFVEQVTTNGWNQIELFVFTVLSLIGAALSALVAACGLIGRRYLTANANGE